MDNNCKNKSLNITSCNCSYSPCPRRGICCECIKYHRIKKELPACFFPDNVETTYDRSFDKFIDTYRQ